MRLDHKFFVSAIPAKGDADEKHHMHVETLRSGWDEKLPFAGYSVVTGM